MQINKDSIRNILVVRNDRFGEFLLNIPALRALKETFTNARLVAVVNPYVKELAEIVPYIDEIIEWGNKKQTLFSKISLIRVLSRKNIDMAIMLNPCRALNIITFLAGIPVRVGYDRKCGLLLTHKIKDKKHLGEKHEVEYNLELVSLVGAATQDKSLSLKIRDGLSDTFLGEGESPVAIHPWTSDSVKQWPLKYFSTLASRITGELKQKVVIIGGKEEADKDIYFIENKEGSIINLAGKTSLRQLAAVLKRCKVLISGDSGPVHLACAVGTPVIAIFSNGIPGKTPQRWGPWGPGHRVIEKADLKDITPDELFAQIKAMLEREMR